MEKKVSINVNVKWNDPSGQPHPLAGVKVEVRYSKDNKKVTYLLGEGYLNANGNISITGDENLVKNNKKIIVRIKSETTQCAVLDLGSKRTSANLRNLQIDSTGTNYSVCFNVKDNNDDYRRAVIASIMQYGANFIKEKYEYDMNTVRCYYPSKSKDDLSWSAIRIHLMKNDFCSVDTILHEYGHQLQKSIKHTRLVPILHHTLNTDLSIEHEKYISNYTAFLEGFADYFAYRVVDECEELQKIRKCNIESQKEYVEDLECSQSRYKNYGEASESSIASILFDLTDKYNENEDKTGYFRHTNDYAKSCNVLPYIEDLEIKDKVFFDILRKQKKVNLYSFTEAFKEKLPKCMEQYQQLLSVHGVAPFNISSEIDKTNNTVKISWIPGGTKGGKAYQTKFNIKVYDVNKKFKFESGVIRSNSYIFKYDLFKEMEKKANCCLIKIVGESTERPSTSYESAYYKVNFHSYVENGKLVIRPTDVLDVSEEIKTQTVDIDGVKIKVHYNNCFTDDKNRFYKWPGKSQGPLMIDFTFLDQKYDILKIEYDEENNKSDKPLSLKATVYYNSGKETVVDLLENKIEILKNNIVGNLGSDVKKVEICDSTTVDIIRIRKFIFENSLLSGIPESKPGILNAIRNSNGRGNVSVGALIKKELESTSEANLDANKKKKPRARKPARQKGNKYVK